MQKMQQAAGGKGRGAGGMPTPAQIQAMQVCLYFVLAFWARDNDPYLAILTAWNVAANAETNEKRWWPARDDEGDDARSRWGSIRHRRNAK